jgi:hypothetical protein
MTLKIEAKDKGLDFYTPHYNLTSAQLKMLTTTIPGFLHAARPGASAHKHGCLATERALAEDIMYNHLRRTFCEATYQYILDVGGNAVRHSLRRRRYVRACSPYMDAFDVMRYRGKKVDIPVERVPLASSAFVDKAEALMAVHVYTISPDDWATALRKVPSGYALLALHTYDGNESSQYYHGEASYRASRNQLEMTVAGGTNYKHAIPDWIYSGAGHPVSATEWLVARPWREIGFTTIYELQLTSVAPPPAVRLPVFERLFETDCTNAVFDPSAIVIKRTSAVLRDHNVPAMAFLRLGPWVVAQWEKSVVVRCPRALMLKLQLKVANKPRNAATLQVLTSVADEACRSLNVPLEDQAKILTYVVPYMFVMNTHDEVSALTAAWASIQHVVAEHTALLQGPPESTFLTRLFAFFDSRVGRLLGFTAALAIAIVARRYTRRASAFTKLGPYAAFLRPQTASQAYVMYGAPILEELLKRRFPRLGVALVVFEAFEHTYDLVQRGVPLPAALLARGITLFSHILWWRAPLGTGILGHMVNNVVAVLSQRHTTGLLQALHTTTEAIADHRDAVAAATDEYATRWRPVDVPVHDPDLFAAASSAVFTASAAWQYFGHSAPDPAASEATLAVSTVGKAKFERHPWATLTSTRPYVHPPRATVHCELWHTSAQPQSYNTRDPENVVHAIGDRAQIMLPESPQAVREVVAFLRRHIELIAPGFTTPPTQVKFSEFLASQPPSKRALLQEAYDSFGFAGPTDDDLKVSCFVKSELRAGRRLIGPDLGVPRNITPKRLRLRVRIGPCAQTLSKHLRQTCPPRNAAFYAVGYDRAGLGAALEDALRRVPTPHAYVEGDYVNYDGTMLLDKLSIVANIIDLSGIGAFIVHPRARHTFLDTYLASVNRRGRTRHGVIFTTLGGVASGDDTTTPGNTPVTMFLPFERFCRATRIPISVVIAERLMWVMAGGDDTLIVHTAISRVIERHFAPALRDVIFMDTVCLSADYADDCPAAVKALFTRRGFSHARKIRQHYGLGDGPAFLGLATTFCATPRRYEWYAEPNPTPLHPRDMSGADPLDLTIDWTSALADLEFKVKVTVSTDVDLVTFYSCRPWRAVIAGESRIVLGCKPGRFLSRSGHSHNQAPGDRAWMNAALQSAEANEAHVPLVGDVVRRARELVPRGDAMAVWRFDPERRFKPNLAHAHAPDADYNAVMFEKVYGVSVQACVGALEAAALPIRAVHSIFDPLLAADL